jgi:hypothetical protein
VRHRQLVMYTAHISGIRMPVGVVVVVVVVAAAAAVSGSSSSGNSSSRVDQW